MSALTYLLLAVLFLSVGYFLGYHVRGTAQQPRQELERQKKSYEVKAERYFGSEVK